MTFPWKNQIVIEPPFPPEFGSRELKCDHGFQMASGRYHTEVRGKNHLMDVKISLRRSLSGTI
jgi:hypothetical protein